MTTYAVEVEKETDVSSSIHNHDTTQTNPYLENMLASFEDAIKIQERFNGMANVNQLAITMFIQRSKS